ncbi:MAG: porin family protein [Bacteroidaceae bacterium]|nr:porin family protein [Bacteroidaceae bacterium]
MKKMLVCLMMLMTSITAFSQYRPGGYSGYKAFAIVDLSINFNEGKSEINCDLENSHGYQFNPNFFLGGGFGIDVYQGTKSTAQSVSVPFFAQTRINFTDRGVSPYIDCKFGYRLGDSGKDFNCWYLQPSFGVRFPVASRFTLNMGVCYTHNFLDGADVRKNKIALQFGLEF